MKVFGFNPVYGSQQQGIGVEANFRVTAFYERDVNGDSSPPAAG